MDTRAYVIDWRKDLELRYLPPSSIRRNLSALSTLLDYLCERNAVIGDPIDGVKRPWPRGTKARIPRSENHWPASCSAPRRREHSRACAIAPSRPLSSITACGTKGYSAERRCKGVCIADNGDWGWAGAAERSQG